MNPAAFGDGLLRRVEDAGLNASAPPQQRWMDGWLLRASPGKAKRARCINAVAPGHQPWPEKLERASAWFDEQGVPLLFRITPYTEPAGLDQRLAAAGWATLDDTRVMVCPALTDGTPPAWPAGLVCAPLSAPAFADVVGRLRGSPAAQRQAHAQRLASSPVPYSGWVVQDEAGDVLACGQFAREGDLVGLYDIHTAPAARSQGLARWLCEHLLTEAFRQGARVAYLQVEADNAPARRVYTRLGFADAYAYHYRQAPPAGGRV
ncbi:GNAT family N-acetyltransferase [Rubrivivax rivuli]|uniref:GNAT family N-acetyltransferase n=1 Tax=Rubrivivax rivuli TaxID=1862385 RepID=A0A437RRY7_9BURK|nr:GNAT family N-acetyltransferase [Rubrivivax rivuli]RVU49455.1 GNAT family N-acetyltransferase [Rubrivivax rivuli]